MSELIQAANLPQLELEIRFYLGQTAQNIIEVGKRLIAAKALVAHGQWQDWLQNNFQLSQQTATNFMNVANRFGKIQIDLDFKNNADDSVIEFARRRGDGEIYRSQSRRG